MEGLRTEPRPPRSVVGV